MIHVLKVDLLARIDDLELALEKIRDELESDNPDLRALVELIEEALEGGDDEN